jgi:serine/threonine protein kinase
VGYVDEFDALDDQPEPATPVDQSGELANLSSSGEMGGLPKKGSMETNQVIYGSFIIEKELGHGRSCFVYLARHEANSSTVAVKIPHPDGPGLKDRIKQLKHEKEVLEALNHPSTPKFVTADFDGLSPYLLMGYAEGNSLQSLIDKRKFREEEIKKIIVPICEALVQAHGIGVVHLGFNAKSVILKDDMSSTILGLSHPTKEQLDPTSVLYLSPEQLSGDSGSAGAHCDVWSFGVLLYVLLFQKLPAEGQSATAIAAKLMLDGISMPDPKELSKVSPRLLRTCLAALTTNTEERPSSAEILHMLVGREPIPYLKWGTRAIVSMILVIALFWGLSYDTKVDNSQVDAKFNIGLPLEYFPIWKYRKAENLSAAIPSRWELRQKTASTSAVPESTENMRSAKRLRLLRPLYAGKIDVEQKSLNKIKVIYDSPQPFNDANRWPIRVKYPLLYRYSHNASTLVFKTEFYAKKKCWSVGDGSVIGPVEFKVGGGFWEEVKITLECAGLARESLAIKVGQLAPLTLDGPLQQLSFQDRSKAEKFGMDWTVIEVTFGNQSKPSLKINGRSHKEFHTLLSQPLKSGPVTLQLKRGLLKIKRITLEGRPVTPDIPSTARITQQFNMAENLKVESKISFEEDALPGEALFKLDFAGGGVDLKISPTRFQISQNGRILLGRPVTFPGGDFSFIYGSGRWRFSLTGNKPFWLLEGTIPRSGELTVRIGSTGRKVLYSNLRVSNSKKFIDPIVPYRSSCNILDKWMNPYSQSEPWNQSKSQRLKELKTVKLLVKPLIQSKSDAFVLTAKLHCILSEILSGSSNVDKPFLTPKLETALDQVSYDSKGHPIFVKQLLEGLGLRETDPKVAYAAVEWGLAFRPKSPSGQILRLLLKRDLAELEKDQEKRRGRLKECLEQMISLSKMPELQETLKQADAEWLFEKSWTMFLLGQKKAARDCLNAPGLAKNIVLKACLNARVSRLEGRLEDARKAIFSGLSANSIDHRLRQELKLLYNAQKKSPKVANNWRLLAVESLVLAFEASNKVSKEQFLERARLVIQAAQQRTLSEQDKRNVFALLAYIDTQYNRANSPIVANARERCKGEVTFSFAEIRLRFFEGRRDEALSLFKKIRSRIKDPLDAWLRDMDPILRGF